MKQRNKKLALAAAAMALALVVLIIIFAGLDKTAGAGDWAGGYTVYISEVMSSNSAYPVSGGLTDWVELHNRSDSDADLSGLRLTDSRSTVKFAFPKGAGLPAGGYLVVPCAAGAEGELTAPFSIKADGGEEILLLNSDGVELDGVSTVKLARNQSMIRDGGGAWSVTDEPSPGFANTAEGRAEYLASMTVAEPKVVITELMASNAATLADAYGDFPDWIELSNVSGEAVDMEGWFLSDDADDLYSWQIPALTLAPGQRAVIFASRRDSADRGELHTDFSLASGGGTVTLSTPEGRISSAVVYGGATRDCSWALGGDGVWAASEAPTPGFENSAAGYEGFMASRTAEGLAINEVMSANGGYAPVNGEYYDWVELINLSGRSLSLGGLYLSDDADEPAKWPLPDVTLGAGELYIVYCSGDTSLGKNHANFGLNSAEDRLYIFDGSAMPLDYALLKGIPYGASLGRMPGQGGFFYLDPPTPGGENGGGAREVSAPPSSLAEPGIYEDAERLEVELLGVGDIYYTLDGSDPDESAAKYDGPIVLTDTAVVRAAAVESGKLMSESLELSFFLREGRTMPIVSLVTDPDNLWDANTGIYVSGNNTNYDQDWEREAFVQLFELSGGGFAMDCGVKLHGDTSRFVTEKKTFKLMFRSRYGASKLNYDLFGDGKVTSFGSILLRAGVDNVLPTLIKDDLFALLAKEGSDSLLSMNSRFCALYLNGEYWGIYAIREAMSEEYYASYHDVTPESVTVVTPSTAGGTGYAELVDFVERHDMADAENYKWVTDRLDVENLIDWCVWEAYAGNEDIWNNLRYYGSTEGDGKWRYALVDLDLTWISAGDGFGETSLQPGGAHADLPRALLKNPEFRTRFMERTAELLSGVLSDEHVEAKIDYLADQLRPEIPADRERWEGNLLSWERQVDILHTFVHRGRARQTAQSCVLTLNMTAAERDKYFGEVIG